MTKSRTGATVVTVDSNSPTAAVSVFFKAGARYNSFPGASMAMEHLVTSGKGTEEHSGMHIVRAREQDGVSLDVHVGREILSYSCVGTVDAVQTGLTVLSTVTSSTSYFEHEYGTQADLDRLQQALAHNPTVYVKDILYKAAYRSHPLGNTAYIPNHMTSKLTLPMVIDFMKKTHGTAGMTVVGSGIDHFQLLENVTSLGLEDGGVAHSTQPAKYLAGDQRIEMGGDMATVIVAGEGAAFGTAESVAQKVAAAVLTPTTPLPGTVAATGLTRAAKGITVTSIKSISESFEDSGLFGFQILAAAKDAPQLVTNLTNALKGYTVAEKDFTAAKAKAKTAILFSQNQLTNLNVIGHNVAIKGEMGDTVDAIKAIDSVTIAQVQAVMRKAFNGKLSVAACGNVNGIPYNDTL